MNDEDRREPVLGSIDRVSEMLFGLFMTLSFVGAVSVVDSGQAEIRTMFFAALGCNLAWGIVDAVMYLVRTLADRGRKLKLFRAVQSASDDETGRRLVLSAMSSSVRELVSVTELEAVRSRIVALPLVPASPSLRRDDVLAAFAVFLIVVGSTFPIVVPFMLMSDVGAAKNVSRLIALIMLFAGGFALGRFATHRGWKMGLIMMGLGVALVGAIKLFGG